MVYSPIPQVAKGAGNIDFLSLFFFKYWPSQQLIVYSAPILQDWANLKSHLTVPLMLSSGLIIPWH